MMILNATKGIATASLALASSLVFAAAGEFDPSFNRVGFTRELIGNGSAGIGLAIHFTDEIVTGGYYVDSANAANPVLWRHLADGSPDTRFGGTGIVYPAPPPGFISGNNGMFSAAIDNQDRIVLLMLTVLPYSHVFYRFNFDGVPDSSFSETGRVIFPIFYGYPILDVTIQPDNKIVAVGAARNAASNHYEFLVYRLLESGELDPSFGGTGRIWTPITPGGGDDRSTGVAIQGDGKIVVGGRAKSDADANYNFALARYSTTGELDSDFGRGGTVVFPILDDNIGRKLVIQPDGKILMAGYTCEEIAGGDEYCYFGVARVDELGLLDPGFGGTGKVFTDVGNGFAVDLALQSDNKIVAVGNHQLGANLDYNNNILVRYLTDGALDSTFGVNGISETNYGYRYSSGADVRIQSDGKIVVAGATGRGIGSGRAVTARYLSDSGGLAGRLVGSMPAPRIER